MKNWNVVIIGMWASLVSLQCMSEEKNGNRQPERAQGAISHAVQASQTVTLTTEDQVVITGTYYPGKPASPTVLCLHQWRSDRSTYAPIARTLQAGGFTVLAIDMRGYGDSQKKQDGSPVQPDRDAQKDVRAAVAYLKSQSTVDPKRVGILGASYGSSNALIYTAEDKSIKAVALLSPGLNYFNVLPTEPAMKKMGGRAVLAVASTEDLRSVEAVDKFKELQPSMSVRVYENAGHGTDMFGVAKEIESVVIEFFKKSL